MSAVPIGYFDYAWARKKVTQSNCFKPFKRYSGTKFSNIMRL